MDKFESGKPKPPYVGPPKAVRPSSLRNVDVTAALWGLLWQYPGRTHQEYAKAIDVALPLKVLYAILGRLERGKDFQRWFEIRKTAEFKTINPRVMVYKGKRVTWRSLAAHPDNTSGRNAANLRRYYVGLSDNIPEQMRLWLALTEEKVGHRPRRQRLGPPCDTDCPESDTDGER